MSTGPRLEAVLQGRLSALGASNSDSRPTVVVPGADSEEIIGCIGRTLAVGLARFILIGPVDQTRRLAERSGVDLSDCELREQTDSAEACALAAQLAATGEAQVMMKGQVQTSDFIRSILTRDNGLIPTGGLIGHVALFDVAGYHKLLLLTDAAITVAPDVEQKLMLIRNALPVASALGVKPMKVACIAPVERANPKVPSTMDAAEIVRRVRGGEIEDVEIGGPFGLDVAISSAAAAVKRIDGPVAGDADLLLMPNLDSGNAVYKSLSFLAGAAVSGIVVGARIPIVLTSRADSEETKFSSLRLALTVSTTTTRSGS